MIGESDKLGLKDQLEAEGRLPAVAINRDEATESGLLALILGNDGELPGTNGVTYKPPPSIGDLVRVHDIIDTYSQREAATQVSDHRSRVARWKQYLGDVPLSAVTFELLETFISMRKRGELGSGRREGPTKYATKNREAQSRRRARARGTPEIKVAVPAMPAQNETIRKEIAFLRLAVKAYARRVVGSREQYLHYCSGHAVFLVKMPPKGKPRTRRISDEELTRLLPKIKCPMKRGSIMLCLYTTLRRSELLSLRMEDISWGDEPKFKLRCPTIPDPDNPAVQIDRPGSKTRTRDVPLIPEAVELLKALCDLAHSEGRWKGKLFPFPPSVLTQAVGRACEMSGVEDFHFHDGRRESVSRLYEIHRLTLEDIMQFTGHTDKAVLIAHYFRPDAGRLAKRIAESSGQKRMFSGGATFAVEQA